MAANTLGVGLVIGASLASSVGTTIAGVGDSLSRLQAKSKDLKLGASIGKDFQVLRAEMIKTAFEFAKAGGKNKELRDRFESLARSTAEAKHKAEQYGFAIGKVAQQTKYLETTSARAEAKVGRIQARMARKQERAAMRSELTGTVAVGAAMFAYPVKTAIGFQQAMAEVGAISRASTEDMQRLEASARQNARTSQFTMSQTANAQRNLANMGFSAAAIEQSTPGLLQLAAAGSLDLAEATTISTGTLNAFKLKASEIGKVNDILALSAASSGTNIQQMGHALQYVAPDAAALNMDLPETTAAVSALSDANIKGERAGTTFRGMLNHLTNPTKDAAGLMKFLSVQTMDAQGNLRALPDILRDMDNAMTKRGFGTAEKKRGMATVFGAEAGTGALVLADAAQSGKLDELTRKYRNADGAAAEMAKRMNETTTGALRRLSSAAEDASYSIGSVLLPPIAAGAERLAAFALKVSDFAEKNPKLTKGLVGVAAGFLGLKAFSIVGRIGLSHMFDGLSLLNGGLQKIRPSSIQAGIGLLRMKGVGGVLAKVKAPFKLFKGGLDKDMAALRSGASLISKGILKPFKLLGTGLKTVGALLVANPIVLVIGAIAIAIGIAAYLIYKNWDKVKAFLINMWEGIKVRWEAAKEIFRSWWDGVKEGWDKIGEFIKAPFVAAFEWIASKIEWVKTKWEGFKSVFSSGSTGSPGGPNGGFSVGEIPGVGHAAGGVFDKPHIAAFAEGGKEEAVVALEGNKDRARSITAYSAQKLGMTGERRATAAAAPVNIMPGAIVINAAPGQNEESIARRVMGLLMQELARRERRTFGDAAFAG